MRPHPRIRTTIKWGGAAVTVLLVVVWIGSAWWRLCYLSPKGTGVSLYAGRISFANGLWSNLVAQPPEWINERVPFFMNFWFTVGREQAGWAFSIPLWIPISISLLGVAVSWRLDTLARRRARLDLCPKCNYDRSGLDPGVVCPECGSTPT